MTSPSRWLPDYRPGTLDKLADWKRDRDRRERIVLWTLWAVCAVAVSYGVVIGILAYIGR